MPHLRRTAPLAALGVAAALASAGCVVPEAPRRVVRPGDAWELPPTAGAPASAAPAAPATAPPEEDRRPPPRGDPAMLEVDLVSAHAGTRWDVFYDDEILCTTPCSRFLDPSRPIFLRTRGNGPRMRPDEIHVPDLEEHAAERAVRLRAHPTAAGRLATGITFTALGGMSLVTGVALAGVGCSAADRRGMCTAGEITLVGGALVTALSVPLILDALPRADVVPRWRARGGRAEVRVGPGVVEGRF